MRAFEYIRPVTIEETIELLAEGLPQPAQRDGANEKREGLPGRPVELLAGGTDLLPMMKADLIQPEQVVDVKRLPELPRGIAATAEGGLLLGALCRLSEIELSALVQARAPLLAEAAEVAATPQLRNMATLGGNLLQRPRCWYFRNHLFPCWLKGGEECFAIEGQNQFHALFGHSEQSPCVAVHPSDLAPALLALEADVELRGREGERTLPLSDLYALPTADRRQETVIRPDELLLAVRVPPLPEGAHTVFLKAMERKVWSFALVSAAAVVRVTDNKIEEARLVLGGVANVPWRLVEAEALLEGQRPGSELFGKVAERALAEAEALEHNGYKVPLARRLLVKALEAVCGREE